MNSFGAVPSLLNLLHGSRVYLGRTAVYCIADLDLLKLILVKHFDKFVNRFVSLIRQNSVIRMYACHPKLRNNVPLCPRLYWRFSKLLSQKHFNNLSDLRKIF